MAEQTRQDLLAQISLLETQRDRESARFAEVLDAARISSAATTDLNAQEALQRAIAKYDEGDAPQVVPYIPRAVLAWLQTQAQRYLQSVFAADPSALHCLMVNRVRANQALLDHPHATCEPIRVLPEGSDRGTITALGLVTGLLTSLGLEPVPAVFDNAALVGFTKPMRNPNRFLQQWAASPMIVESLTQTMIDELRGLGCNITEIHDSLLIDVPSNAWQQAMTTLSRQFPPPNYIQKLPIDGRLPLLEEFEKRGFQWLRVESEGTQEVEVHVPMDKLAEFKDLIQPPS